MTGLLLITVLTVPSQAPAGTLHHVEQNVRVFISKWESGLVRHSRALIAPSPRGRVRRVGQVLHESAWRAAQGHLRTTAVQ